MKTNALIAAARFFSLAETAAANGGFWVSSAGGTANVVAGEISRATGVSFENAHRALNVMGNELIGEFWYQELAYIQPFRWDDWHNDVPGRWDARTIARAACRTPTIK
jgi:hypothetical protein